jgi:hypothetical protein
MAERTSAGELEQRYKIKHLLLDFTDRMKAAMYENIQEKGMSWQRKTIHMTTERSVSMEAFLKGALMEHARAGEWVAVANYAFMLDDREKVEK